MSTEQTQNLPATISRGINLFDKEQFETLQRLSKAFASSDLVPDIYRASEKNPESKAIANCLIAIDLSQRIGANPLLVMQNLYVVQGKPSWSSSFLIATVNSCGRFEPLKFTFNDLGVLGQVQYTEYTKTWVEGQNGKRGYYKNDAKTNVFDGTAIHNFSCVAYTCERGSGEILQSTEVTVRMAVQEGWYTKPGSKWPTITKQMLMYRAAAFWTRSYAPELSLGMKTVEEVRDIDDQYQPETPSDAVSQEIQTSANKERIDISIAAEQEAPTVQAEQESSDAAPATQEKESDSAPIPSEEQPIGPQDEMPDFMK